MQLFIIWRYFSIWSLCSISHLIFGVFLQDNSWQIFFCLFYHVTGQPAMVLSEAASARLKFDLNHSPQLLPPGVTGAQGWGFRGELKQRSDSSGCVLVWTSPLETSVSFKGFCYQGAPGSLILQFGIWGAHGGATCPYTCTEPDPRAPSTHWLPLPRMHKCFSTF